MSEHTYFEELCALVVSGLASEEEFREFEKHLQTCEECWARTEDFVQIGAGILLSKDDRGQRLPAGMTSRFVARAVAEGIPLRQTIHLLPAWASHHPRAWAGAIAASVLFAVFAVGNFPSGPRQLQKESNKTVSMPLSAPTAGVATVADHNLRKKDETENLKAELTAALTDKQSLAQALSDLTDRLNAQKAQAGDLTVKIATLQSELDQIRQQSSQKDEQIAELNSQVKQREEASASQIAFQAESQIQIRTLRDQLAERDATIQDQHQLLTAGGEARNLIIARNLHIIDVHDNNGDGRRQQAFGRIFYTEGKQIVFYAYDLNSAAKLKKQVAFYVWGGKLNDEHAAKTLGILRSEDAEAGRWALTFNDPHVLAEINTVFVTAESKKNVEHPDGKPILFAFLGTKANHP